PTPPGRGPVAQSTLVTIFHLSVAGGGLVGGLLLESAGAAAFPWALFVLALAALGVVAAAKAHGFTPGHRVTR
ncbi:MFS transporter, partial [Streptomyces sp. TRM76130]|nr:MFS transporter [Streptomyces sp. TRM76130]